MNDVRVYEADLYAFFPRTTFTGVTVNESYRRRHGDRYYTTV